MEISNALDWPSVAMVLITDLHYLEYNSDLHKIYQNIDVMVKELSKLEVPCRRIHNYKNLVEPLARINKAIDYLEKLILMAKLMA